MAEMERALAAWVGVDHVDVTQLSGGSSNLTFRVRSEQGDWVLRRPPTVHVLATANDMRREYTVQTALRDTGVPVARTVAFCDDEAVLGAPFYLMEYLDGIVFNTADDVRHLTEEQSLAASYELMDALARLHGVEYAAVGLGNFGKPAGFVERQVHRWVTQWEKSKQRELPEIDEVATACSPTCRPKARTASSTATTASTTRCSVVTSPRACSPSSTGRCRRSATRSPTSAWSRSTGPRWAS